jgi:Tol biopolymer transport system component
LKPVDKAPRWRQRPAFMAMTKRISSDGLGGLTRRRAMCIVTAAGIAGLPVSNLRAIEPIPIALPDFLAANPNVAELASSIPEIVTANLKRSGLFAPIDHAAFIGKITSFDATPHYADWHAINAQALVTGRVSRQPDGRIAAAFRLWDVVGAKQLGGQQYFSTRDNVRRIAHIISDQIYERLTGERGYFEISAPP